MPLCYFPPTVPIENGAVGCYQNGISKSQISDLCKPGQLKEGNGKVMSNVAGVSMQVGSVAMDDVVGCVLGSRCLHMCNSPLFTLWSPDAGYTGVKPLLKAGLCEANTASAVLAAIWLQLNGQFGREDAR